MHAMPAIICALLLTGWAPQLITAIGMQCNFFDVAKLWCKGCCELDMQFKRKQIRTSSAWRRIFSKHENLIYRNTCFNLVFYLGIVSAMEHIDGSENMKKKGYSSW